MGRRAHLAAPAAMGHRWARTLTRVPVAPVAARELPPPLPVTNTTTPTCEECDGGKCSKHSVSECLIPYIPITKQYEVMEQFGRANYACVIWND
jgi:hypothetical protein